MMIDSMPSSIAHVKAGRLKVIAVSTAKRIPALPDVPTFAESGVPGYDIATWYGVWAPPGTRKEILTKLQTEIAKILQQPDVKERLASLGAEAVGEHAGRVCRVLRERAGRAGRRSCRGGRRAGRSLGSYEGRSPSFQGD